MSVPLDLASLDDFGLVCVAQALKMRGDDDALVMGELAARNPGVDVTWWCRHLRKQEDRWRAEVTWSEKSRLASRGRTNFFDVCVYLDGRTFTLGDGTTLEVKADRRYLVDCPTMGKYELTLMAPRHGIVDFTPPVLPDPVSASDVLGNRYQVGSMVAVAVINSRSPQMVFAEVTALRATDSGGVPVLRRGDFAVGDEHVVTLRVELAGWAVQALPVLDARGFSRSGRLVTYKIVENIIAVP